MNQIGRKKTKSERTREAILAAARVLFAERGYDGATVRDIAAKAEIDPSMVIRYFGGKDALFAEAAELNLRLPDLSDVPRDEIGVTLVRHFLMLWEGEGGVGGLPVALRSAASNELAAERLRAIFTGQVIPALAKTSVSAATAVAGLVSSQLLGLAFCRYVVKLPPVVALSPESIITLFGGAVQSLFEAKAEGQPPSSRSVDGSTPKRAGDLPMR